MAGRSPEIFPQYKELIFSAEIFRMAEKNTPADSEVAGTLFASLRGSFVEPDDVSYAIAGAAAGFWGFSMSKHGLWNMLEWVGISRYVMEYLGVSWNMLEWVGMVCLF